MIRSVPKPKRDTRRVKAVPVDPIDAAWGRGFDSAMRGDPPESNPFDPVSESAAFAEFEAGYRDANH